MPFLVLTIPKQRMVVILEILKRRFFQTLDSLREFTLLDFISQDLFVILLGLVFFNFFFIYSLDGSSKIFFEISNLLKELVVFIIVDSLFFKPGLKNNEQKVKIIIDENFSFKFGFIY